MAEEVALAFIARQLDQLLARQGSMEGQITVLTGMVQRLDGAVSGLSTKVHGLYQLINRLTDRARKLEDT